MGGEAVTRSVKQSLSVIGSVAPGQCLDYKQELCVSHPDRPSMVAFTYRHLTLHCSGPASPAAEFIR